jgi:hypothetical protein
VTLDPKLAFANLPSTLMKDLLDAYSEIITNFADGRWEPSELNGGKLSEVVFTVVSGYLSGSYSLRSTKPRNLGAACVQLENAYPTAKRSPRIQIPRMIIALYEIRNNRGVGHAGGDVDPNQMDATAVLYMSKWLMAELVRLLHGLTTDEAAEIVEALVERQVSMVWKLGDKRRVLRQGLTWRQQVLILLSGVTEATEMDLVSWLEHKVPSNLRRDVLRPMHRDRMVEFDEVAGTLRLLPPGIEKAEMLLRAAA